MVSKLPINELSSRVIGAAIEVHRALGPGLLESAYEACLCRELTLQDLPFVSQRHLPVEYKGVHLDCGYRIDVLVDERLIVELKAVDTITNLHKTQLMTYLRLMDCELGLLINFNVPVLVNGVSRVSMGAPNLEA